MAQSSRLLSHIDSLQTPALKFLESLVNINSFTRNCVGVNQVQSLIEAFLQNLGLRTEQISIPDRGNALRAFPTGLVSNPILLLGHADTVHPPESPFRLFEHRGDILRGPGTLDMKAGILVILWALQALHAEGLLSRIPFHLLINSAEEEGNEHSVALVRTLARTSRAALVFEWGRANDGIIVRRKGIASFELHSLGRAAHSGNEHRQGLNAIVDLSHAVSVLSQLTDYDSGITVNVGTISGGTAVNTVPEHATIHFEFRAQQAADFDTLLRAAEHLAQTPHVAEVQRSLRQLTFLPPMVKTERSAALLQSFTAVAAQAGLACSELPGIIGGASDANHTAAEGCPTIDGLGPFGSGAHTQEEQCSLSSLSRKTKHLALWLASQAV